MCKWQLHAWLSSFVVALYNFMTVCQSTAGLHTAGKLEVTIDTESGTFCRTFHIGNVGEVHDLQRNSLYGDN